ncbi:MAG: hypothetical protein OHK0023_11550 [Anaerolineae bacterium]
MRNTRLNLVTLMFGAALLLAACGTPASPTPQPTNTTAPTVAPTEPITATVPPAPTAESTEVVTPAAADITPTVAATEAPTAEATATEAATAEATAESTPDAMATAEATAAATVAALPTIGACRASGDLVVGTDAAYPPFENVNTETGQIEGFDIDLLNAIGEKAGFNPQYNNVPFDPIFINLAAGQYDIVISASTITEERSKTVAFSNPYFAAGQVIATRKDDASTLNTPAALAGKTVGVQLGTTGAEAAKGINGVTVREYQTLPEAMTALSNRDVDAVIGDNVTVLTIILNQPELNLAQAGDPFTVEYYGIAVRQECTELLKAINDGLQAIIEDGTYQTIYEKYLGEAPAAEFRKGAKGILPTVEGTPEATSEATSEAATVEPTKSN